MNRGIAAFLVPLALVAGGCATTSGSSGGSRNVISAEELAEVEATDAFDAIQKLRPAFLRRGRVNYDDDTVAHPIVYMDGMRLGGIDELRYIRPEELVRVEYLSGGDATVRYGTGHKGGALLLTSRAQAGS